MRRTLSLLLILAGTCASVAWCGTEKNALPSVPGYSLVMDSVVYTPDNLWNIIDGAADAYLLYGFESLHTGEYLSPDSVDVRAELYRHSSAANAFGIYSQERKPEYRFIEVGTEGYIEDGVLNFLCGSYYVKLTSHTMGSNGRTVLRTVADRLVAFLNQEKGFPSELSLLPAEGRIRRSESYIADSYLGYSFFRSAYIAQYDSGKTQLFVMRYDSPEAAREALSRYMQTLKMPEAKAADGGYTFSDPNNGTIGVLLRGRYLCGVANCENERVRNSYLDRLKKGLAGNAEAGR